jgi:hypothetical protein
MAKRFEDDLGLMPVSKPKAVDTVLFAAPVAPAPSPAAAMAKSLSVKLDGDLYNQLLAYCFERLRRTGTKLYHQEVMVEGLKMLLEARRQ